MNDRIESSVPKSAQIRNGLVFMISISLRVLPEFHRQLLEARTDAGERGLHQPDYRVDRYNADCFWAVVGSIRPTSEFHCGNWHTDRGTDLGAVTPAEAATNF